MLKLVSIIRRKPGMEVEEFQRYWRGTHASIVSRLPGLRRYVQSHTLLSGYATHSPVADGIAELWFDDTAALRALHGSPEQEAIDADEDRFMDAGAHIRLFLDEYVIKAGPVPVDGVKNIEFVRRKTAMPVGDFQRYWLDHHGPLAASIGPVMRYVQNHARASSYRDGRNPAFDGLAVTWFRDTDAMRESASTPEYALTRDDEVNFLQVPLDFIITREHVVVS